MARTEFQPDDKLLARFVDVGAVTSLNYANRLTQLPLAIFAGALATAMLPTLTRHLTANDTQALHRTMNMSLRLGLMICKQRGEAAVNGRGCLAGQLLIHDGGSQCVEQVAVTGNLQFKRAALIYKTPHCGTTVTQTNNGLLAVITKAAHGRLRSVTESCKQDTDRIIAPK